MKTTWQGQDKVTRPQLFMKRGYFIWQSEQLKLKEVFKIRATATSIL